MIANHFCSLRDMQGAGGGSPRVLCFKVLSCYSDQYFENTLLFISSLQASCEYALAQSTSTVSTAALASLALPIRSPAHVYQCAALRLQSTTVGTRAAVSVSHPSWWGIAVASSDDRVAQQLLQVQFLHSDAICIR